MLKKTMLLLAAATALASGNAWAANITYTGVQQVGSITANYYITTDGSLGSLAAANITAFSVSLTDSISTISFDQTSGTASGRFDASLTSLSTRNVLYFRADSVYNSYLNAFFLNDSYTQAQIADMAHAGANTQTVGAPNNVSFATVAPIVTSAVPEPATWAMMMLGVGIAGASLRRRRVTTRVRFA